MNCEGHPSHAIASEGQSLLADVRNGKGTVSKLIYDDALYQEIRSPIKRVDAILAEIQAGNGSAGKLLKEFGTCIKWTAAARMKSTSANSPTGGCRSSP